MKVEIPEIMITRAIDNMVSDFDYRLQSQGMNIESYIQYTGMNMEAFRENFREQAVHQVKARLALEKIAKLENFEISEEEIENEYKKVSERYSVSIERVKSSFDDKYIAEDVKCNKSIDLVKSTAIISETQQDAEETSKEASKETSEETLKETSSENSLDSIETAVSDETSVSDEATVSVEAETNENVKEQEKPKRTRKSAKKE